MSIEGSKGTLTAADLKSQLPDIQDNVVAPILMRYGRHIFWKFGDGAKARAWLRQLRERVNANRDEHGARFTVNVGFTYEGLKTLGLSSARSTAFHRRFAPACAAAQVLWVTRARMLPNTGTVDTVVPTYTPWAGFAPSPNRDVKRQRKSSVTRWRQSVASRSATCRTRCRSRTKTGSAPKASICTECARVLRHRCRGTDRGFSPLITAARTPRMPRAPRTSVSWHRCRANVFPRYSASSH